MYKSNYLTEDIMKAKGKECWRNFKFQMKHKSQNIIEKNQNVSLGFSGTSKWNLWKEQF